MNLHALFVGVLLASPAWCQEPSFDIKSESVRNIVRATAATQSRAIEPIPEANVEHDTKVIADVVFDEKLPEKPAAPQPPGFTRARHKHDFLSEVLDTILDDVLDVEPKDLAEARFGTMASCLQGDELKSVEERLSECPGRIPDNIISTEQLDSWVPPGKLVPKREPR
ncbi:MAG TPA: hypothetical protein VMF52_15805 [Steroidobacteraceae bacterium]|nr:hypothetical protein [Steroidobacteraceae bacterium]